jgi:hypothetical protein
MRTVTEYRDTRRDWSRGSNGETEFGTGYRQPIVRVDANSHLVGFGEDFAWTPAHVLITSCL